LLGIAPPESKQPDTGFIVWYDGQKALNLFLLLQTQWRHGFAGITGLDYAAVVAVINLHAPRRAQQRDLLDEIAAIETGALRAFGELRPPSTTKKK
jgi:hypothetical protein